MREFDALPSRTGDPRELRISRASDEHEQETNRVAEMAMRTTPWGAPRPISLAMPTRPARSATRSLPDSVIDVIEEPGIALDDDVRYDMERRFGRGLPPVRIHQGGLAERSSRAIGARAFTIGRDMVFGAGEFAPHTAAGRHILAHELTHALNQSRTPTPWIDRQSVEAAPEKPEAPYYVTPLSDEVALRSSPRGRRSGRPFHNLAASLLKDVKLLVEGREGRWIRVRAVSGTALDGRTNLSRPAAGLVGYVSDELLTRTGEPIPAPITPESYHSLDQFTEAWPYKDPTGEAKKLWLGQSKQAWTNKALAAAGIRASDWVPLRGFRQNKEVFRKVYAYYTSLYLADKRLKWAAMAKLAGGEVYRGFRDQIVPAEEFGEAISEASRRSDGAISVGDVLGGVYQIYAKSIDVVLMEMQRAIFMDLAWQHHAYREGGIEALSAAMDRGEIDPATLESWRNIDSGVPARVSEGNVALLRREQYDVLQASGRGGYYKRIQDIPDNDLIPETMSEEAVSPIPGGKPFSKVVKGGDITTFDDRWKWLEDDMVPAFERLGEDELDRLVRKSLDELANRRF